MPELVIAPYLITHVKVVSKPKFMPTTYQLQRKRCAHFFNYNYADDQIDYELYKQDYKSLTERKISSMNRTEKLRLLTVLLFQKMIRYRTYEID